MAGLPFARTDVSYDLCDGCAERRVTVRDGDADLEFGGRAIQVSRHEPLAGSITQRISLDQLTTFEMLFTYLKHILNLTRLRLRGPNGARDEFLLAATAQNLRKLAKLRPVFGQMQVAT